MDGWTTQGDGGAGQHRATEGNRGLTRTVTHQAFTHGKLGMIMSQGTDRVWVGVQAYPGCPWVDEPVGSPSSRITPSPGLHHKPVFQYTKPTRLLEKPVQTPDQFFFFSCTCWSEFVDLLPTCTSSNSFEYEQLFECPPVLVENLYVLIHTIKFCCRGSFRFLAEGDIEWGTTIKHLELAQKMTSMLPRENGKESDFYSYYNNKRK